MRLTQLMSNGSDSDYSEKNVQEEIEPSKLRGMVVE